MHSRSPGFFRPGCGAQLGPAQSISRSAQILGRHLLTSGECRLDSGCDCKRKKIVVDNGVVTVPISHICLIVRKHIM